MKRLNSTSIILALISLSGVAHAAPSINAYNTIKSGVKDTSNLWYGQGSTGYGFSLTTQSTDPTYFLNSISLVPGTGWDANLTFGISNVLGNGFVNNNYTLGTALGANQTYYWSDVAVHSGAFASTIASGIYNFNLQFKGGTSSSSTDILLNQALQVEIVNKIDAVETVSYNTNTISPGQMSTVSSTLQNNMTRSFISTTWFISGVNHGSDSLTGNFVGNWFDQTILGGASRTDLNSTWTASSTQVAGLYTGSTGVIGGLYAGDNFYFGTPDNTQINVVPEPGAWLGLAGVGLLIGTTRRRKA